MGLLALEEFRKPQFLGYVENRLLPKEYLLKAVSDTDETYDLKFDYDVFTDTYAPSASITGWNSGAPLRDKQGFKTLTQEIAKIQHGVRIDEREQLMYQNPRVPEERSKAIKKVYDMTDRLIEGVYDTEEFMRAQALYKGRIEYTSNGILLEVDFKLPAVVTMTIPWSDRENATPLDDLRVMVAAYKKANGGQAPAYIDMSGAVLLDLELNAQMRGAIFGVNNAMVPDQEQVQAQIRKVANASGLTIRINDQEYSPEGGDVVRYMPERTVTIMGAKPIITVTGPTVEKDFATGIYVTPISKEGPPPSEEIYVGESAFVAVQRPNQVHRLAV